MELVTVGLDTRFQPVAVAPGVIYVDEVLLEQLHLHMPEVVAHALDDLARHLRREVAAVGLADGFAHGPGFLENVRQVGVERVAHAFLELGEHAGRPVVALQFEAVAERRADLTLELSPGEMHRIGKFIEVAPHGLAVEMVHHGAAGARSTQNHARIARQLHEEVEHVLALRYVDGNLPVAGLTVVRHAWGELLDVLGHQADEHQLLVRVAARIGDTGIRHAEHLVAGDGEFSLPDVDCHGIEHLHLFVGAEVFGSERPARADDDVAGHAPLAAAVGRHVDHMYPFVAQPRQCRAAHRVGGLVGELDGIDFHAPDAGLAHQIQFAQDFPLVDAAAVPPPAYVGTVAFIGILEHVVKLFFGTGSLDHRQFPGMDKSRSECREQQGQQEFQFHRLRCFCYRFCLGFRVPMRVYITAIPACVAETLRSSLDIGRTGRGHARRIEVFGQSREPPPLQHAAVRGVGPGHRRHRRQRPGKRPQARAGIRARPVAGQHISRLTLRIERMVFAQQAAAPTPHRL